MRTLTQIIESNPLETYEDLGASEIIFIKLRLEVTIQQILAKYGKFKVKWSKLYQADLPLTTAELVSRIPKSTKEMLWAINNARTLIGQLEGLTIDLQDVNKRLRSENLKNQAEILILKEKNKQLVSVNKKIKKNIKL